MNPTIDNDLQKAIDDITKTTGDDPVFADPVAAPAPEAVGPFPSDTPNIPAPKAPEMPAMTAPAMPPVPETPAPEAPKAPVEETVVATEETIEKPSEPVEPFVEHSELSTDEVKEAALRSLAPLLGKLDLSPEYKFDIYKNVIDNYHDSSVLGSAYQTATDIKDDKERGEALLYIVESIDKM